MAGEYLRLANEFAPPATLVQQSSMEKALSTLHCPSRRDPLAYPVPAPFDGYYGPRAARTDYAMCGGSGEIAGPDGFDARTIRLKQAGVWQMGHRTSSRDILDGLSQTYMAGEKSLDPLHYTTGRAQGDQTPLAADPNRRHAATQYVRYAARPPQLDHSNDCMICHDFGSAHHAGWNALMSDGSVDLVTYFRDIELHRSLGSIRGREVVQLP